MGNATRPNAVRRRMDTASRGLKGTMRNLARMLANVDFEEDEDKRVFGFSGTREPYVSLREAARAAVAEASAATPDDSTETA